MARRQRAGATGRNRAARARPHPSARRAGSAVARRAAAPPSRPRHAAPPQARAAEGRTSCRGQRPGPGPGTRGTPLPAPNHGPADGTCAATAETAPRADSGPATSRGSGIRRRRREVQQLKEAPGRGRVKPSTERAAGKWGFHKRYTAKKTERKPEHHPNGLDKPGLNSGFARRRAGRVVNCIIVRCIQ